MTSSENTCNQMTYLMFLETICQGFASIHEVWAVPIELGIALWLLERQLGLAFLAPAAVAIFAVCLQVNLAHPMSLDFTDTCPFQLKRH